MFSLLLFTKVRTHSATFRNIFGTLKNIALIFAATTKKNNVYPNHAYVYDVLRIRKGGLLSL